MMKFLAFLSKSVFGKKTKSQGLDHLISKIIYKMISALIKIFVSSIGMFLPIILIFCVLLVAIYGILPSRNIYDGNYSINSPNQLNKELEAKYIALSENDKAEVLRPLKSNIKRFEVQREAIDDVIEDDINRNIDDFVQHEVISKYFSLSEKYNERINKQFDTEMQFLEPYHLQKSIIGAIDVLNNKQRKSYANLTAKELKTNIVTQEEKITIKTRVSVYKDGNKINSFTEEKYIPIRIYKEISHAYEDVYISPEKQKVFEKTESGSKTKKVGKDKKIKYTYHVNTKVYYPVMENIIIDKSDNNENRAMDYMTNTLKMTKKDYSLFQIAEGSIRGDLNNIFASNYMEGSNQNYVDLDVDIDEDYVFPITTGRISGDYGWRIHPILHKRKWHGGLDIGASTGTPVYAVSDGVVNNFPNNPSAGNFIVLEHSGTVDGKSRYLHLSGFAKKSGATVKKGELIGYVGNTGRSKGSHLHLELFVNGKITKGDPRKNRVHPLLYMRLPKSIKIKSSVNIDYILEAQEKMNGS